MKLGSWWRHGLQSYGEMLPSVLTIFYWKFIKIEIKMIIMMMIGTNNDERNSENDDHVNDNDYSTTATTNNS